MQSRTAVSSPNSFAVYGLIHSLCTAVHKNALIQHTIAALSAMVKGQKPPLSSTHKISFIEFSLQRVSDALLTGAALYVMRPAEIPCRPIYEHSASVSLGVALL